MTALWAAARGRFMPPGAGGELPQGFVVSVWRTAQARVDGGDDAFPRAAIDRFEAGSLSAQARRIRRWEKEDVLDEMQAR